MSYQVAMPSKEDFIKAEEFIKKYGGLNFDKVKFRPGASYTDVFGLTDRYKKIDGKYVWGYPGIHTGTDRGRSQKTINEVANPVIVPFDTVSSSIFDDGGKMYGTIVSLFHEEGFVIRICHMYPNEIELYDDLKNNRKLKAGTLLGPAGQYGMSQGIHTHTDVESYYNNNYTKTSPILDALLYMKYGENSLKEISNEEIVSIYKICDKTKDWNEEKIINDYNKEVKAWRGILFLNKYKYVVKDYNNNVVYTRYGTKPLFDM